MTLTTRGWLRLASRRASISKRATWRVSSRRLIATGVPSAVLCARILLEAADENTKKALLPKIASGERVFALALTEAQYGWSADTVRLQARRENGQYVLNGTKLYVHDAAYATDLLVVAKAEGAAGASLFHVDAKTQGVGVRALEGFLTDQCEVKLESVRVSAGSLLGAAGSAQAAIERAMLSAVPVLCAYKVGACKAVFDMSLNYARERKQFGKIIGSFQRVQDNVIHLVNYVDAARWTTYEALWKVDNGMDAAASVHVAKSVASESYLRACDFGHEVHAGIGVMREYGLTLHTKMSRSLYHCLGAPKAHRRQLERALGLVAKS